MQTYSHIVMTILLGKRLARNEGVKAAATTAEETAVNRTLPPVSRRALLLGSIAPDAPLILMTAGTLIIDIVTRQPPAVDGATSYTGYLFDTLFFENPWVMAAQNLFHAPLLVLSYFLAGFMLWRRNNRWAPALFWFGAATSLHSFVDILLHYDDGPLLLFPFEWSVRFHSPVSYWDPARYGIPFTIFEHLLVLVMLFLLIRGWRRSRRTIAKNRAD